MKANGYANEVPSHSPLRSQRANYAYHDQGESSSDFSELGYMAIVDNDLFPAGNDLDGPSKMYTIPDSLKGRRPWIIDSGASTNMSDDASQFEHLIKIKAVKI